MHMQDDTVMKRMNVFGPCLTFICGDVTLIEALIVATVIVVLHTDV